MRFFTRTGRHFERQLQQQHAVGNQFEGSGNIMIVKRVDRSLEFDCAIIMIVVDSANLVVTFTKTKETVCHSG